MKRWMESISALPLSSVARRPDVVLAVLVSVLVGMMIIPLPLSLLDVFLAVNIAVSVMVLMGAVFSKNVLEFTSFPSLLLITTLFRLGLNISTTRGILARGEAGEVVQTFGRFVLQGDLVVGLVIFLVITMVQFLVIAKGSERVAEVAARFNLDAMPGKQMSIDAALRQGALTEVEAQRKRQDLDRESQLFGNMDGAMKFVKGDAIAGLVITAINLIGGFAIGLLRNGLSLADAAQTYALLTIGDGLVAQISSLLITLAAGVVMTRVQSHERESSLGFTLQLDLFRSGWSLLVSAGVCLALALVPGLPFFPFSILAAGLASLGLTRLSSGEPKVTSSGAPVEVEAKVKEKLEAAQKQKSLTDRLTPSVVPITLELDPILSRALGFGPPGSGETQTELLDTLIPQLRDALYLESGVRFPGVRVVANSEDLPRSSFSLRIRDVPALSVTIDSSRSVAMCPPERLVGLQISATPITDPIGGGSVSAIPLESVALVEASGVMVWNPAGFIALHLAGILRRRTKEFMGVQEVTDLLERLEKAYPALVKEVVPKVISVHQLLDVLRRLLDEQVSIRDLKAIL